MTRIAVLGAGSWGTALARHFAAKGLETRLWARRPELAAVIDERRENPGYLPGVKLPPELRATSDLAAALDRAELVMLVVPSHGLRELARRCKSLLPANAPIVSATKGIENESLMLMTQV